MSDIFLSYAREDREKAEALAAAFKRNGWSVWWDRELIIGTPYEFEIEEELAAAKCVVVLWSKSSVKSEWVRNEAGDGSERDILVPALIERVKPPLAFRGLQTADLVRWRGDADEPGFRDLCRAIAGTVGASQPAGGATEGPVPSTPPPWSPSGRGGLLVVGGAVAAVVLVVAAIFLLASGDGKDEDKAGPSPVVVAVESDEEWTRALTVRAGQTIEITARGEIDTATDQPGRGSGPDGIKGEEYHDNNVIAGVAHAALIGKLGDDGRPTLVGSYFRFTAPADGVVYLGVNDKGRENNGGRFDVTIVG